jgi:hypothetical protein
VAPGSGHLQRPLDVLLSLDVGHVGDVLGDWLIFDVEVGLVGRHFLEALELHSELSQALYGYDLQSLDQRGLRGIYGRDEDALEALFLGHANHGQDALGVAHCAVEGEFADEEE